MLILLPISLFFVSSLVILILRWVRPAFSYTWLIAGLAALFSWAAVLILRLRLPQVALLAAWKPASFFASSPALAMDAISWPFAFALASLVFAVILTATARSQYQTNATAWAGSLMIGGLGLIGVLSANPLTLVIAWAAIDVAELVFLLGSVKTPALTQSAILAFAAQTGGIFLMVWAMLASRALGVDLKFAAPPEGVGVYMLLAAGFRLGVLPLHLPYASEPPLRRGLGSLLRLAPLASSLMLLARLPGTIVPPGWSGWLLGFTALAALYGSVMWVTASDEIEGRPFWMIGLAALAVVSVIRGNPAGSIAWGIALLLSGGLLFLYSARGRRLAFFWALGLWGVSGLPYSTAAGGWNPLLSGPEWGLNVIFVVAQFLFLAGYIRHALRQGDQLSQMERWVHVIYPIGLLLIGFALVFSGIAGWKGSRTPGMWGAGLVVPALAVAVSLWLSLRRPEALRSGQQTPLLSWVLPVLRWAGNGITTILRLDWLYRIGWLAFRGIGQLVGIFTTIVEGDGGVLWALLLLTLILSLFRTGGAP